MSNRKVFWFQVLRWVLYFICAVFGYVFMTIDLPFVKPIVLLPMAVVIAINEDGELRAALGAVVCGLILDTALGSLFGFSAILLVIFSVFASLVFVHLLQPNIGLIFIFCLFYSFIFSSIHYVFTYFVWGYDYQSVIFTNYTLPTACYTAISTLVIYPLFRLINRLRVT